jgi:cell division protein ZipA
MAKLFLIFVILIILSGLILYTVKTKHKKKTVDSLDNYFISTQSASDDRVKKLGLDKSSEIISDILDTSKLDIPQHSSRQTEDTEYKPDPDREWIINIHFADGHSFETADLDKLFDKKWRTAYPASTIYGYSNMEQKWTYAMAGDSKGNFKSIQVAIKLLDVYNEDKPVFDSKKLEVYLEGLKKTFSIYPEKILFQPTEPSINAINKAKKLVELNHEFDVSAILVLSNDKPMDGKLVWDVLQSVGLKWGDGDLFHWNNTKGDFGDDSFFSVWTTTTPGYFLPESIKSGQMNPQNLVFGFSIPRSADPEHVFSVMLEAVNYCHKRLGGKVLNGNGLPLDETSAKDNVSAIVSKMNAQGLVPGSDQALTMF